jgi:hypothetical protein
MTRNINSRRNYNKIGIYINKWVKILSRKIINKKNAYVLIWVEIFVPIKTIKKVSRISMSKNYKKNNRQPY